MVLLIVASSGQENAHKNCGFICFFIPCAKNMFITTVVLLILLSRIKENAHKTVVLLVLGSPVSLRHAGEPPASCPRLHGNAKNKESQCLQAFPLAM